MARLLFTRRIISPLSRCPSTIFKCYSSYLDPSESIERENELCTPTVCDNAMKPTSHARMIKLPYLIPTNSDHLKGFSIELVDPGIWPLTQFSGNDRTKMENEALGEMSDRAEEDEFMEFEEIEDLRLRKMLFYKLDRDSKEFEEYNVNFHLGKSLKKKREKPTKPESNKECKKSEKPMKPEIKKECMKFEKPTKANIKKESKELEKLRFVKEKRVRTRTFNQLTAPYHIPFCLDIFITKGSVRASIIHRVTSKVVAVAHSISKDLRFDVGSRKDAKACVAVGGVLAQRAIEDDIHNVIYTPRKGDKIEGKLQTVLQSIIDNGVDVKVKLKQKKPIKRPQP